MPLDSGTHLIGRYEILSMLGAGGMGEVYRAKDLRLGREVAIKILPEHLALNPDALSRFEREAKAVALLSHPNILAIYDFGSNHDVSFAVMELLEGETLRKRIKESPLPWRKATEIALPIAEGLSAAHSKGVTHRDLKPENIFLTSDGQVKILDFGLAQLKPITLEQELSVAPTQSQVTQNVTGTVPYLSPEQVRGVAVDTRSDIFSFGSVLYEMLTGNRAFAGTTAADTMAAILKEEPKDLDELKKKIPPELERVISHCLEKNPEQRVQTARDLAFDLKAALSGSGVTPSRAVSKSRFRPVIWMTIALVILLAGASVYMLMGRGQPFHSLAILPFANASRDKDAEYLSDGITESITDSLSNLPKLRVMAHDTVFTYKGKQVDPRKAGRDLNVEAVVTGQVTQQGDTLVVRAVLVKVADGTEIWGEQYKRKLADVLIIQEEISREISRKLKFSLMGQQEKQVTKHYTKNSEAYQLYLKGRYYWYRDAQGDHEKSIRFFQQAIEKDPNYALAYAGLANTYLEMGSTGDIPPAEALEKAKASVNKALQIDSSLNEVNLALGNISGWDAAAAAGYVKRVKDVYGLRFYSLCLMRLGRREESIAIMKQAVELDPLSLTTNTSLGARYFWAKEYDQAIEQLQKTVELDLNYAAAHDLLADVYERKRMYKEAISERQKFLNLVGDTEGASALGEDFQTYGYEQARRRYLQRTLDYLNEVAREHYVSPVNFAQTYALLNEKDQAFAWLEKCYQEHSFWLGHVGADPQFDNLRSDPRFAVLLKRISSK